MKLYLAVLAGLLFLDPCRSEPRSILLGSGEPVQVSEFRGRAKWKIIPYLWFDKSVNITCPFTKVRQLFRTLDGCGMSFIPM